MSDVRRRVVACAVLVGAALATRAWGVEPMLVPSTSMMPTLQPGDRVVVEKVSAHLGQWDRGALVVFEDEALDTLLLKRLVGLPGDRVAIRDGVLSVNGHEVTEPYVDLATVDGVYYGPVRVPDGHVLVLGDNREASEDSRRFGPVPADRLEGRAVAVVWPLADAGWLTQSRWSS